MTVKVTRLAPVKFTIYPVYKHWWYRFMPKRRREAKTLQTLVDGITSNQKFIDDAMSKFQDAYLYGQMPVEENYNFDGKSILKVATEKDPDNG